MFNTESKPQYFVVFFVAIFPVFIAPLLLGIASSELDRAIDQFVVANEGGGVSCLDCGLTGKRRDVRRHVEAKHMINTHTSCNICGKVVKTRDSLRKHVEKDHRAAPWQ